MVLLLAGSPVLGDPKGKPEGGERARPAAPQPPAQPQKRPPPQASPPPQQRQQQPRQEAPRPPPQQARPEQPRPPSPHARPEQREARPEQPRPPPPQQARPEQHEARPEQARHEEHEAQPIRRAEPMREGERHAEWQEHRARDWSSEHRGWTQRGGYTGYRIPESRYDGSFGRGHGFRFASSGMVFVGGIPRFQYGGFRFSVLDPWPEYWAPSWYDDDDVYVEYFGDGYYLLNPRYPGDRIAVSVYLE